MAVNESESGGRAGSGRDLGPVKIVVADDHAIWRSGLKGDLGDNFIVVGEAADADEAIAVINKTKPDLVLTDLHMPGGKAAAGTPTDTKAGGIAVARAVGGQVPVVMLTVSDAESDLLEAVAAGAVGYLLKSISGDELRRELWKASRGEPVFSPSLAALVLTEFRRMRKQAPDGEGISDREREVLQLVARGHTYGEIGEELHISPKTVENHVRNILKKLQLSRKNELIRYAIDHGIE